MPRLQPAGQQGEGFRSPVGQQDLGRVAPVPRCHGRDGRLRPWVGHQPGQRGRQACLQPSGRVGEADVDGEVELAVPCLRVEVVAVVIQVDPPLWSPGVVTVVVGVDPPAAVCHRHALKPWLSGRPGRS
jgi:hypothetical protein